MRNSLLATAAVIAVAGFTTLAVAQNAPKEGESGKAAVEPHGTQQMPKGAPAGTMKRQPNTAQTVPGKGVPGQSGGASRDTQERMGQDRTPDQNGTATQRGAEGEHGNAGQANTSKQGSRGASVQLSQDQRTRISSVIGKGHAAHADVNFSVSVGAMVPRSVHIEVLPEDIVEIVPQYEGFDYVVVGDEILIVDPDTMEIVAVIPS